MAINQSINIQYPVKLFGQPTDMTCWSAATTMLFGTLFSAGPGSASLSPTGGLKADVNNIQAFAQSYNLRLYYPQSWTVEGLIELLRRGPVALMGPIPSLHAVVIGGIRGDGTAGSTGADNLRPLASEARAYLSRRLSDFDESISHGNHVSTPTLGAANSLSLVESEKSCGGNGGGGFAPGDFSMIDGCIAATVIGGDSKSARVC